MDFSAAFKIRVASTIHEVERSGWDHHMAHQGACSWQAMAMAEGLLARHDLLGQRSQLRYVTVSRGNRIVAQTLFSQTFLDPRVVVLGSPLGAGFHFHLDRGGPWQDALNAVVAVGELLVEETSSDALLVPRLPAGDAILAHHLCGLDFARLPARERLIGDVSWPTLDAHLAALPVAQRQALREQQALATRYTQRVCSTGTGLTPTRAEFVHLHHLHRMATDRGLRLDTCPIPAGVIEAQIGSSAWEVVLLHLDPAHGGPADGLPVAFWSAYRDGGLYAPFLGGLDERHAPDDTLRHALFRILMRGRAVGAGRVDLGVTACDEKVRLGARAEPGHVFVRSRSRRSDSRQSELLGQIVTRPEPLNRPSRAVISACNSPRWPDPCAP